MTAALTTKAKKGDFHSEWLKEQNGGRPVSDIPPAVPFLAGTETKLKSVRTKGQRENVLKFDRKAFSELAYNGLTKSADLMKLQRMANAEERAVVAESKVANTTFRSAVVDGRDALVGVWEDLYGSTPTKKTLWEIVSEGNRLRGLGVALIAFSLGGFVIDASFGG